MPCMRYKLFLLSTTHQKLGSQSIHEMAESQNRELQGEFTLTIESKAEYKNSDAYKTKIYR